MAKRTKKDESLSWEEQLHTFFESPMAEKAASFLSERALIALHVEDRHFLFRRKKGKNDLRAGQGEEADVHFWIPPDTLRYLLDLSRRPEVGIGTMGVAIIEHLFQSKGQKQIRVRVETGFLGLWGKGYFSVLKAGGPEVASYLSRWGFDSLSKLKEMLRKIRG